MQGALTDGFDGTTKSLRTLFPGALLGYCLRHALNKLPSKLMGLSAPVRKGLRSEFHTLLSRCRQRKSLRVALLGQSPRRFADHITTSTRVDHGERVWTWFEDKKTRWHSVFEDPQMPMTSTLLDHAHNAVDQNQFVLKGFHHSAGSQAAVLTGLAYLYNLVPYQRRVKNAVSMGWKWKPDDCPPAIGFSTYKSPHQGAFSEQRKRSGPPLNPGATRVYGYYT